MSVAMGERDIEDILKTYPSLFQLEDHGISRESAQQRIELLERDLDTSAYYIEEEYVQAYNCLTHLHIFMDNEEKADEYYNLALQKNVCGIITLTNKARMLYRQCDFAECKEICEQLQRLSEDKFLVLDAEAHQAFCYSLFGTRFSKEVISKYRHALKEYEFTETSYQSFIMWKYSLGKCLRRLLNIGNVYDLKAKQDYIEGLREPASIFFELIEMSASEMYQASAYVQLGDIAYSIEGKPDTFPDGIRDIFPPKFCSLTSTELFEKALELGKDDVFVLERCGKQFRYTKDYERAKECFKKAIQIRPTSLAHHHLALTLKSILNTAIALERRRTQSRAPGRRPEEGNPGTGRPLSTASTEKTRGLRMTKCPRTVQRLPDDQRSKEILEHLDKAIYLSDNTGALYDKGLTLRALGKFRDAKRVFAQICNKHRGSKIYNRQDASPMYVANSFEQQAWCLLEEAEETKNEKASAKIDENVTELLMRSIEMTTNIAESHPCIGSCWMGLPELEKRLMEKEKTVDVMMKRIELQEKVGQCKTVIELCLEVMELNPEKKKDPGLCKKRVINYVELRDYASAIGVLDAQMQNDKSNLDRELYLKAHIEGGFDALKEDENELAKKRLKNAFNCQMDHTTAEDAAEEDGVEIADKFDAYICCSNDENDAARCIWKMLKNSCGLSATVNTDDVRCGRLEVEELVEVMKRSKHFIIVLDKHGNIDRQKVSLLLELQKRRQGSCNVVVVKTAESIDVPVNLGRFPALDFSLNLRNDVDYAEPDSSEGNLKWTQELLSKLLISNS